MDQNHKPMIRNFEKITCNLTEEELQIAQSVMKGLKKFIGKPNAIAYPANVQEIKDTCISIQQRVDSQIQVINQLSNHI